MRRLADGQLAFLGRLDHQVKVRGFRIEPGEMEAALLRTGEVAEALVVVRTVSGDAHLVAYVAGAAGSRPDAVALRERLREDLPEPLVPGPSGRVLERDARDCPTARWTAPPCPSRAREGGWGPRAPRWRTS